MKLFSYFLALGAFVFALGLGAKFAESLTAYAMPLIVGGLIIHGIGHSLQYLNWRRTSNR